MLIYQLLFFTILSHVFSVIYAIRYLRDAAMSELLRLLWVVVVLLFPVLGAVSCLMIRPGKTNARSPAQKEKEFKIDDFREL